MKYGTRQHDIACLSSQRWDEPMWTNKQHIMSRLAAEHRVLHVDYGSRSLFTYLRHRFAIAPGDLAHPAKLLTDGLVQRHERLWTGDHWVPLLDRALDRDGRLHDYLAHELKLRFVSRFWKEMSPKPIVWVYHPAWGDAARALPRKLLVYDCVDDYSAFPDYANKPWLVEREERLCRQADLVFATSEPLYELRRAFNPHNTFLVHNVGDAEHFHGATDPALAIPDDLARLRALGPVIGFVGAVSDYKLDLEWIEAVARARPSHQLVLIGPVGLSDPSTDVGRLALLPNVHLLGVRPYKVLPAYLKGFDVAVIPYRVNPYTTSVFPIKFFEFLATGKPVVISALPALARFYDAVRVAQDAAEFIERCDDALAAPPEAEQAQSQARIALAHEHSWPARIGAIMGHIERRLDELGRT